MQTPAASCGEINKDVMEIGKCSLELLQRFVSGRVSQEDLLAHLNTLGIDDIISRNWNKLTSDARYVPHWKVIQTLQGLIDELGFQLGEYGLSTLHDDINEIAINLKRISEQTS